MAHPQAKTKPALEAKIRQAWAELDPAFIRNAAQSLKERAAKIRDAQGKYPKL